MFEGITKKRKNRAFNYAGWGLLVLVCGIFIFTGYSPNLDFGGNGASVAQVNGEIITYNEFSRMYDRAQEERDGSKLTGAEREKLKQEVVSNLVNRSLIIQAAKKQGIFISAKEMADYLMQIPQFQENGKFSLLRYKQLIKAQGMSEARFEEKVGEDLLLQKMNSYYMRSAREDKFVKDAEDKVSNLKLNIQFIAKQKSDLVTDAEISTAELDKFMQEKNERISAYYKDNVKKEFTKGEEVQAQHLLIKTSPTVTDAQALEKIKNIAKDITPANFTEMARRFSEDPGTKDSGGELGFFSRGRMAPEFEDMAFDSPVGKVSAPFKTPFGYHLLLVNKKAEPRTQELNDVKAIIAKKLLKEDKMTSAVGDIKAVLQQGPEATQKMLAQKGWVWDETGTFSLGDIMVPKLGDNDEVVNAAFTLTEASPIYKDVVEKNGTVYLVKLKSVGGSAVANKVAGLNQEEMLKQIFERQKSYEAFQGWLDHLKKNASVTINNQVLSTN